MGQGADTVIEYELFRVRERELHARADHERLVREARRIRKSERRRDVEGSERPPAGVPRPDAR